MAERRLFSRIDFKAKAWLVDGAGHHHHVLIRDLSLHGVLAAVAEDWPGQSGDRFELQLDLDSHGHHIIMQTCQRHHHHDCIGLECLRIDIDSAGYLRRLVELNLGDDQLLQRQLAQLVAED
ncbi:PilZ domain-containing protein [Zobellella endophytica]|uniref:Cyclic diguanosine monophosphate-binding protein n=1 Tax=Zobellella endophytica TaxID=2116700 RepID=A0A2P7R1H2_9GAMM|nr:PilZ domain-containing protein [Zobellella endophytica]PSJ44055.1 PilZ domain-containing protein [Zobellella endophytica]